MGANFILDLNRRAVVGALLLLLPSAARSACRPTRVLFVCQAGTVKSPLAREALRQRARARGVSVLVQARGLAPEDHVTPAFLASARADGLDPRAEPVTKFAPQDLAAADLVVSFEPPREVGLAAARDWSDTPSFLQAYPAAHARLIARIDALVDEIARRPC